MKKLSYTISSLIMLPTLAFAQSGEGLDGLLDTAGELISTAVGLLFALAVFAFFWGLALYIFKPEDRSKGINIMILGTIALFVMASIYGLIALLGNTVGIEGSSTYELPDVPGADGSSARPVSGG